MLSTEEKDLINKIINKNEQALLNFYKINSKSVSQYIYRQLKDWSLAEEIAQDVFLDFIEGVRDFRGQSSVKTFLFTIARNKTIDFIRKKKFKKILFSALPPFIVEKASAIFLDDEIEKKELAKKIKEVFSKMPNDYQLVLRLKYIDGERVKTIANKLSLGFKATESLLFRARMVFVKIFQSIP